MLPNGRTGTQFSMRGALAATVSSIFILSSFAVADPGETKIEAVLSNLPAPGSPAYSTLYAAADRPHREVLDMTKAEVWTIAPERFEAITAAATKAGAKLTKLDATWNHPFAPMATSTEMTAEQKAMMHGDYGIEGGRRNEYDGATAAEHRRICADQRHARRWS